VVERYILYYYYIESNYMIRRLIMTIFRLYMNHLISSCTNIYIYIYMGYLYRERGGGKVGTRYRICQSGWYVWDEWRVHAVIKLCLSLIIAKSMVDFSIITHHNHTMDDAYHRFSYNKA